MKNNILSKLLFVFVAIFSFMTFNCLVKADTVVNITSEDELSTAKNNIQNGSANQTVIWNIQSDITITGEIALNKDGLNLTINGNGHTITATKNSGGANKYALSLTSDKGHSADSNISINDLKIVVGDRFRSGILIQSKSSSSVKAKASFNNVSITMAQENQPIINSELKWTCPLVINHSLVYFEGTENKITANEWSWSAIDMTSNPYNNSVLEIKEGATLNITDARTVKKASEPVVKLSSVDGDGNDIETDFERVYLVNPERANLVRNAENGYYYFPINEIRLTMTEIKVGNTIPTTISVSGKPTGALVADSVSVVCYVSDTELDDDPDEDSTVATGRFEDGKYYYCEPNFNAAIDGSYIAGEFTTFYVNGEEVSIDYFANYFSKWIKMAYTYELKENNELSLNKGEIKEFVLTIDGDDTLFESLEIGNLSLVKDTDYTVTHGSTIITFTEAGIAKLNTLAKGEYDVKVKYTNGKTVTTKLTIDGSKNPKTSDSVLLYGIIGLISALGVLSVFAYRNKVHN